MKNLKIQVPEGYEIDKEKSTFENIILKKIGKKRPLRVQEIEGREWYIDDRGRVDESCYGTRFLNNLSTKERAEAFLALMQLVELRDAWNEGPVTNQNRRAIVRHRGVFKVFDYSSLEYPRVLEFTSEELAKEFLEEFRDLIETAKELI